MDEFEIQDLTQLFIQMRPHILKFSIERLIYVGNGSPSLVYFDVCH